MRNGYLYRAYNPEGTLLYVGSTDNFYRRWDQHIDSRKAWVHDTSDVDVTRVSTLSEAREMEREAIAAEHPRWNLWHRSRLHPEGYVSHTHGTFAICRNLDTRGIARYARLPQDTNPHNANNHGPRWAPDPAESSASH